MTSEIEELRKQLEQEQTLKEMYFTYYKAKHSDVKAKLFQYKQALAEIKEIAEYEMKNLTDSAVHGGRYLEILDKISEVEL